MMKGKVSHATRLIDHDSGASEVHKIMDDIVDIHFNKPEIS